MRNEDNTDFWYPGEPPVELFKWVEENVMQGIENAINDIGLFIKYDKNGKIIIQALSFEKPDGNCFKNEFDLLEILKEQFGEGYYGDDTRLIMIDMVIDTLTALK